MRPPRQRRRSLLDSPQRLGVCPTLWFWNDWDRQRLLLPLILAVALPVAPLTHWLTVHFQAPIWPLIVVNTLYPFAVMGLVERRIRRQLRRLTGASVARTRPPLPTLPFLLFSALTIISVLLLITITTPFATSGAVLVLLTLLAGVALAVAMLPRAGRAARQLAASPAALSPSATSSPTCGPTRSSRRS